MTVVHVITGLMTGGAEIMLLKLLRELRSSPIRSVVVSLGEKGSIGARIEELGVEVHALNIRPGRFSLLGLRRLRVLVRQLEPSLIQGWMYHGNVAASIAQLGATRRAPVLWNIRQSLPSFQNERLATSAVIRAGALLSSMPRRVIYNSGASATQHAAIGYRPDRGLVVPNGFDCDEFRPSAAARLRIRRQLGVGADALLIGLVARFHPVKDHATFFRAAALTAARHQNARFILAGRGVDSGNASVRALIPTGQLADRIHLLGECTDTAALNNALDIAALCSSAEAFPNVVGEAMACGVPCVVTDVGDAATILGGLGRVCAVGDAAALAAGWCELIDAGADARQSIGLACRSRILQHYSIGRIAKVYESIYQAALSGEGP